MDGTSIAFQSFGSGDRYIAFLPAFVGNLDAMWEQPEVSEFLEDLSAGLRVILHDPRGTGLSGGEGRVGDLETRMNDLLAVLDAEGVKTCALFGSDVGGAVATLACASHPDRVSALAWFQPVARTAWASDYPWGETAEVHRSMRAVFAQSWGSPAFATLVAEEADTTMLQDPASIRSMARWHRAFMAPSTAVAWLDAWYETDIRDVLPLVHVPTLVLARTRRSGGTSQDEYVADLIPNAQMEVLSGTEASTWMGDRIGLIKAVRVFLDVGTAPSTPDDRVLATVMFTDIVDSTATAAAMGDEQWRSLIEEHDRMAMSTVASFRGTFVRGTGDGMLATFDGPARAVHCARAFLERVRSLGIQVRAGCHTGEITYGGQDLAGLGVHVAARVAAMAGPSEVWASSTVKDLTAGSGLTFEDAGEHELKGVPEHWHLYRVVDGA